MAVLFLVGGAKLVGSAIGSLTQIPPHMRERMITCAHA